MISFSDEHYLVIDEICMPFSMRITKTLNEKETDPAMQCFTWSQTKREYADVCPAVPCRTGRQAAPGLKNWPCDSLWLRHELLSSKARKNISLPFYCYSWLGYILHPFKTSEVSTNISSLPQRMSVDESTSLVPELNSTTHSLASLL